MKKIIVALAHFGSSNREYFLKCLKAYNDFTGYHLDIHLYLTEDINCKEFSNLAITKHLYDRSIGKMLPNQHKALFNGVRGEYDYYLYCEDDVLITEANVVACCSALEELPLPYACGFLRYEHKEGSDYKYLIDCHPAHSCHRRGTVVIKSNYSFNGVHCFETYNMHQGSYLLSRKLFDVVVDSGNYLEPDRRYTDLLESAASDVYYCCGIVKVYPRERVNELLVHHLADKYVKMLPDVYTEDATPDNNKLMTLQNGMKPEKTVTKVVYDNELTEKTKNLLFKIKLKISRSLCRR